MQKLYKMCAVWLSNEWNRNMRKRTRINVEKNENKQPESEEKNFADDNSNDDYLYRL